MATQLLGELEPTLSTSRLRRYRSPGADDLDVMVNYLWNMALAEALYIPVNTVEIALRNALHSTLSHHFGTPSWYDRQGLLEPTQVRDVHRAKSRIRDYGNTLTPDRVVSELTFGFWVTILSRNYDTRLWQGQHAAPLKQAFPRVPRRQRQRGTIHRHYNAIRELRNRVFHHEPLFDDRRLRHRHDDIYQGIHWINPHLTDYIRPFDRFPDVQQHGRVSLETILKHRLGVS